MGQYRKERLAHVIRNVVSSAITHRIHDPRVEPLTTVTRVELSSDLYVARVYVTVPGRGVAERRTEKALQSASGFMRRLLAKELTIRHCPELKFEIDETVKRVQETMALIDELGLESDAEAGSCDDEETESDVERGGGDGRIDA